jgi:teichuronic acid biosynthesis glycosyltransferase TuaG
LENGLTPSETRDISVIITFHNREQYIDEAIQSVLAQTLQPLEIIIVNDGSRESARRFLDRYAGVCTIVDLPVNVGIGGARHEGVLRAKGQYIAFLDDDDMWLANKLEVQRRYMAEHPECDWIHCGVWAFFVGEPDEFRPLYWPGALTLPQALTFDYILIASPVMVRAEVVRILGGFDRRFRCSEDRDFQIRCVAAGYRIESLPEALVRLRRQGQDGWQRRYWRIFVANAGLTWKHRALYFRVFGVRGLVSSFLETAVFTTKRIRYLGGAVRLLLRLIPIQWQIRADYREQVQQ